ncbi:RNA polymerase recycling motor HelD [Sulfoacidibacillus ferrooxidans]|uniref:DNA 3'-5' helicase n=1 Tax=Sulfoacidibacillus ferrooxidans TaxID=2005001 RepID=A0A9X1V9W5_9BACL|nr:RNA polymerase recycling motor HelD [Sulfoacidibacillus ferrooxidans]MCI0183797.1 DNA helicase IV [Sulfoacidibacillus ferrooxidans]
MAATEHPDYEIEKNWLAYTRTYIDQVMRDSEKHTEKYKANIKEAMAELDDLDSSQSYINILTNTQFLHVSEQSFRQLSKVHDRPYFCRIDFIPESENQFQKLYIGKTSLFRLEDFAPIIVDWRSPIASVYYDGRIGSVSYETPHGEMHGELLLKRQYTIEKGVLLEIRDIDITTRDELLQASLSASSDSRLTDIIATIQAEQNKMIRADIDRPLIVQGVAGSGKTTIALHRIAYFIYTYAERFSPNEFMILAPNKLFLRFISEVLPELGVEDVKQTTFIDFMWECIGKKYKLIDPNEKLLYLLQEGRQGVELDKVWALQWSATFKGSPAFRELIDDYLQHIEQQFIPNGNLRLGQYVIYTEAEVKDLFVHQYQYLPMYQRIEKIKRVLSAHLKSKSKIIIRKTAKNYEDQIEDALDQIMDPKERHETVVRLMDERDEVLADLQLQVKVIVKKYMVGMPKLDVYRHYIECIRYVSGIEHKEVERGSIRWMLQDTLQRLEKKQIEIEDSAALLYLQQHLYGVKHVHIKTVVIDEAQDFSIFQLIVLKEIIHTELFTILGDLSQGIHSYRSLHHWDEVIKYVFPRANYLQLEQSYRTTIEIMHFANAVISLGRLHGQALATSVVRHGPLPEVQSCVDIRSLVHMIQDEVVRIHEEGMKSIAVIAKTPDECQKVKREFECMGNLSTIVLGEDEAMQPNCIAIVPVHIAKGLEFDAVFIVTVDEQFVANDIDSKLLYVACTRALHRLFLFQLGSGGYPTEDIDRSLYQ